MRVRAKDVIRSAGDFYAGAKVQDLPLAPECADVTSWNETFLKVVGNPDLPGLVKGTASMQDRFPGVTVIGEYSGVGEDYVMFSGPEHILDSLLVDLLSVGSVDVDIKFYQYRYSHN